MDYLEQVLLNTHRIDPNLYEEYDVKRGLRDSNGKGVLTGLTEVSDVCGFDVINGRKIPAEGSLYYQGINVNDLVHGLGSKKFGFEETIFLLLFGRLPKEEELKRFLGIMFELESLSGRFVRDVVMKASNSNIMNAMQRCILTLYTYDDNPEDISVENVLRQSLELIAKMPLIAVYSYHAYRHFRKDETLLIRNPECSVQMDSIPSWRQKFSISPLFFMQSMVVVTTQLSRHTLLPLPVLILIPRLLHPSVH